MWFESAVYSRLIVVYWPHSELTLVNEVVIYFFPTSLLVNLIFLIDENILKNLHNFVDKLLKNNDINTEKKNILKTQNTLIKNILKKTRKKRTNDINEEF